MAPPDCIRLGLPVLNLTTACRYEAFGRSCVAAKPCSRRSRLPGAEDCVLQGAKGGPKPCIRAAIGRAGRSLLASQCKCALPLPSDTDRTGGEAWHYSWPTAPAKLARLNRETKDEARRMPSTSRLPELLGKGERDEQQS